MTNGFFGGDMSVAHWSVSIRFNDHGMTKDERQAAREKLKADRQKLKDAGIKPDRYFQFKVTDKAGKATMKIKADAESERITKLTGVTMAVHEGCFL